MNLTKNVEIVKVKANQSAGTSAVTSDAVDMANWDGVVFFSTIATANAGNFLEVEQSEASDFASAVTLEGTKAVAAENGDMVFADVYRPLESQGRYLRAKITRGASSATGDIYAIKYAGRTKPETNAIGALVISPEASE